MPAALPPRSLRQVGPASRGCSTTPPAGWQGQRSGRNHPLIDDGSRNRIRSGLIGSGAIRGLRKSPASHGKGHFRHGYHGAVRGLVAILLASLPLLAGCGGDDVPDAHQLPLADAVTVAAETTRDGDDNSRFLAMVLTAPVDMSPSEINHAEVAALRAEGWRIRRYRDGDANAYERDGELWAFIGLDGGCQRLISEQLGAEPQTSHICASLGQ